MRRRLLELHIKKQKNDEVSLAWNIMFTDNEKGLLLNFLVFLWYFWAKQLMEILYLLIIERFLVWSFRNWEIRSFFEPKSWWKDYIYWLLKVVVLNFLVMKNTVFFWVKKLMERWYLLGLFELSMIFQGLGNMVFGALIFRS